jgi:hypothetical protein
MDFGDWVGLGNRDALSFNHLEFELEETFLIGMVGELSS